MADNIETKENNELVEKKKVKVYPTQVMLTIRVIVGGYVLYSMYQVMTSEASKSTAMYAMVVVLALVGGFLVVWSLKNLVMGEYEGGKADKNREIEENTVSALETEKVSEAEETKESEVESVNDIAEVIEP